MAKNSITDYSKTAASNTDIQSVDIAEGCLPSGINNAIREIMADLADMNDGTVSLTSPSFAAASLTGNLSFGDNDKAIFGAGSDLQIYHDGSDSYVKDAGTGYLNLLGTGRVVVGHPSNGHVYLNANYGGDVELFFNNSKKLETTSTGIDVTGTVTADGLTVDTNTLHVDSTNNRVGIGTSSPAKDLHIVGGDFSGLRIVHETDGTTFNLQSDSSGNTQLNATTATDITFLTNNFERMRIDSSGNVGIGTSLTASSSAVKTLFSNTSGGTYIQTNSGSNGGLVLGTDGGGAGVFFTYTGAVGSESYSERMRITSSGNVGIGTTSPDAPLEINKASEGEYLRIGGDNASNARSLRFTSSTSSTGGIGALHTIKANSVAGEIAFANGDGTFMYLQDGGRVGIGTSDVKGTLHAKNTSDNATLSSVAESIVLSHQSGSYTSGNYYNVLGFAKANSNGGTLGASIAPTMDGSGQTAALTFGVASGGGSVAERMRIDSSGNVGIGTAPASNYTLHTHNAGNTFVYNKFTNSTTGNGGGGNGLDVGISGVNALIYNYEAGNLQFATNASERMRIDSSGHVGIGRTDPAVPVDAKSTTNGDIIFRATHQGSGSVAFHAEYVATSGTAYWGWWIYNNAVVGSITSTGSSTAYNTSSDYRLKENVKPCAAARA